MSVIVRCSCVLSRLNSDNISRPRFRGNLVSNSLKLGKNVTWLSGQPQIRRNHLGFDENTYLAHAQQRTARFKRVIPLVFANALMLTAPLRALSETCVTDVNSDNNMPLFLLLSLVGAIVGGLLARQRRGEMERLNEQLRQINAALRRQAKIESYAPSLSYAPVGGRVPEEVIVDPRNHELVSHLKTGKIFLRNQNLDKAYAEFKTALELAQYLKDPIKEKKAARGLGASLQRQRKYKEAIKYHTMVLDICAREGESSGDTDAYGAIADCYTGLGDLDQAGKFYDKYIARLETD